MATLKLPNGRRLAPWRDVCIAAAHNVMRQSRGMDLMIRRNMVGTKKVRQWRWLPSGMSYRAFVNVLSR
jgi:hypothetical protein